MIQIDKSRCVGCGLCVRDCFPGALSLEEHRAVLTAKESCIGCGHCIGVCPKNALGDDRLPMDDVQPVGVPAPPEELLSMMRSRRSCRHYQKKPVPEELLENIIQAVRACPTAKNLQETRFIVVTERIPALLDAALEALGALGKAQLEATQEPGERRRAENFIRWAARRKEDPQFDPLFFGAPLLLMLVSSGQTARDTAAGAAYGELMAASQGLGCLYSGYFTACAGVSREIPKILGLEEHETVVRCLVLGYPDIKFQRTAPRRPPDITRL